MADVDREHPLGIIDKRKTQTSTTQPGTTSDAKYMSVSALKTRLAAIDAGFYTTARLNSMTKNDMVFAVRTVDDTAGF